MPTTISPDGIFRGPYLLRLLVAYSTTFQAVVGAINSTSAALKVYYPFADIDEDHLPSRAVVVDEQGSYRRHKNATGSWKSTGTLRLNFDFLIPHAVHVVSWENSSNYMMVKTGAIMKEMEALAGTGEPVSGMTHLNMQSYSRVDGPVQLDMGEMSLPDLDNGEFFQQLWNVEFELEFF